VIARHFRAGEPERELDDPAALPSHRSHDELVWVDLERDDPALGTVLERLGLTVAAERLAAPSPRPELLRVDGVVVVSALGLEARRDEPQAMTLDIAAGENAVLTVRDGQVAGLDDVVTVVRGRSRLGDLDAATFVAVLLDGLIGAYFEALEDIEQDIDRIDDRALRAQPDETLLTDLVAIRRRIARLRRALAPQRSVVSALARPDLGLRGRERDPWPAVAERLERAVSAAETARELLIGSFDLLMTRTGQRTNDIVRVLTVVSVTLLPAGVIAGLLGMNFQAPIFEEPGLFVPAVLSILGISALILAMARMRAWI
jgi:Mg2+ and Co2+ transporter CorA